MTPRLHAAAVLPERVYRIGRAPDPWACPDWAFAGDNQTFGNRFDDPRGRYRVLYASTEREATFRECLAPYRPDPAIVAATIEDDGDDVDDLGTARDGSPLGDELTNWAVFEPRDVVDPRMEELAEDDPDLLAVPEDYDLVLGG